MLADHKSLLKAVLEARKKAVKLLTDGAKLGPVVRDLSAASEKLAARVSMYEAQPASSKAE